jgi:hypothetical protein
MHLKQDLASRALGYRHASEAVPFIKGFGL